MLDTGLTSSNPLLNSAIQTDGIHAVKPSWGADDHEGHGVESPGQAWNVVTVGAYTKDVSISDSFYKDFMTVASMGELSPYSSTSDEKEIMCCRYF